MILCLRILARAFSHQAWGGCGGPWPSKLKLCLVSASEAAIHHYWLQHLLPKYKVGVMLLAVPRKSSPFLTKFTQKLSCLKWSLLWDTLLFSLYVSNLSSISFCSLKIALKQSFQNDRALKIQTQCSNSSQCWEKFKPMYWFPIWFEYIQNKWQKFVRKCHSAKECCSNRLLEPFTNSDFVHSDNYYLITV